MTERVRWAFEPEKTAWMLSFIPGHSTEEVRAAFAERFGVELTASQVKNFKVRHECPSGTVGGRFEPGRAAHNRGLTWDQMMSPEAQERSRSGCFKPGGIPWNGRLRPVGYERVTADGYVEVKVADHPDPDGPAHNNWVPKARLVYEREVGPVPPGHKVVFADGDKANFDPSNLVAVEDGVWGTIRLRGIPFHDAESLAAAVALARLVSGIKAARRSSR